MKYIQRRIERAILIACCVTCLFEGMQPMYLVAAESSNHIAENPDWTDSPSIMGESGIVIEASTGTILYEKNMYDIHYPASITKIMTALLAIESCEMNEIVTVPPEAVYMEDKGTHIALDTGEQLKVEQCLYAIMLASANDAAYALAEHVGGTYENFIRMMNEKARVLGCQNTNFTNPHGLPDENHVTSAYDMALITKAALQYDMFQTISGASYYEIPPTEHQKDLICMYNHHKMIGKTELQNEEVFAGKNGYTDTAGHTLVTCAKRDDMAIICVVMQDQGEYVYQDTLELLNYGLDNFSKVKISERETEMVTAQYFYEDHLVGQVDFLVDGIQTESDSLGDTAGEPLSEEKEDEESSLNWKHIIFAIIVGIMIVGAFLIVSLIKGRSRNNGNKLGKNQKGKAAGENGGNL